MKGLTGIANIERDKSISSPHRVMPVGEVVPAMTQGGRPDRGARHERDVAPGVAATA